MPYRSQAGASVMLGTPLAFSLCGLYAQLGPAAPATNYLTAIFLLLPVWCAILIWGLTRQTPRAAWLGLAGAFAVAIALIAAIRQLAGV